MKKLITIFCLLFSFVCFSQTTPFAITTIPNAQPDFTYHPGRGLVSWTYQWIVDNPVQGTSTPPSDDYIRYAWYQMQDPNATGPGLNMTFTDFDNDVHAAITAGRGVWIGLLVNFGDQAHTVGGAKLVYPTFVHNQMQGESVKDFINGTYWYENPNSTFWHDALAGMLNAWAAHINTTSFNGVPYTKVIKGIDCRIVGDFGEGAVLGVGPTPNAAPLIALVDAYKAAFPNIYIMSMIGNFSGGQPGPTGVGITPQAVSTYLLQTSNSKGLFGWRRDNWGQTDGYIRNWTDLNPNVVGGFHYDTAINNRWKYAPIIGEPQDGGSAGNFPDLPTEITRNHGTWVGNGNFNLGVNATIQNNFRAAALLMGYRYVVTAGNMTTTLSSGGNFTVATTWQNVNTTAAYDDWVPTYELRLTAVSAPVWSSRINPLNLKTFYPGAAVPISQNFTLPAVAAGTYGLYLIVRDSLGFRQPMPVAITGRLADGSYLLRGNIVISNVVTVQANAGPNQSIVVNNASLTSAASVGATSQQWSQISGPNTATITTPTAVNTTVTGLVTGTYVFQVCVNGGPCSGPLVSQVTITVNLSAPVVANAGPDQNVTLPTSSASLSGSASTGTITSYAWTFISGPTTPTITTPATVGTTVTGMTVQGAYIYQLSLNSGVATDRVTINELAVPPASNAGPNQNISTSSTTLNGSSSIGATSYSWTRISGPNSPTIATPTTVSTNITGMITGTYVFQLAINGGSAPPLTSTVTVVVNIPAPPVAVAGANQTIGLPTSSVALDGSGSTGAITTWAWTLVSAPATATPVIATPTSVTTNITALSVAGTYVFRLSVNGGVSTSNVTITVNPPIPQTNHVFGAQTPVGGVTATTENDGNQGGLTGIELGMKFTSGTPGIVSGVRFYKTNGNAGTHIGFLYNATGTLLAQVTFVSETANGWQDAFFSTPVHINANTVYVVAYFSPLGNYISTINGFNTAVVNGQLTGLASGGAAGVNGVYNYANAPRFPTLNFQKSNYWVDADFTPDPPPPSCNCIPGIRGHQKVLITLPY